MALGVDGLRFAFANRPEPVAQFGMEDPVRRHERHYDETQRQKQKLGGSLKAKSPEVSRRARQEQSGCAAQKLGADHDNLTEFAESKRHQRKI